MLTASYVRNLEKKGIEIRFSEKPSSAVRENLLENNWRYSGTHNLWYNYYSAGNLAYAKKVCDKVNGIKKSTTKQKKSERQTTNGIGKRRTRIRDPRTIIYGRSHAGDADTMSLMKRDDYSELQYAEAQMRPLGQYMAISPRDRRYQRKRSFFS